MLATNQIKNCDFKTVVSHPPLALEYLPHAARFNDRSVISDRVQVALWL